jgi:two-component system chemotaxis sensor kinase CheA
MVATRDGDALVVEIADDGRGIDWSRVRDKATAAGLPANNQSDLVEAVFADGVSTAQETTELSGRGVGLAAVRAACKSLGGAAELDSTPGQGTRFRFRVPVTKAAA